MDILWCGQEDMDFEDNRPIPDYGAGRWRTSYARYALEPQSTDLVSRSYQFWGGGVLSCWLSCYFWTGSNNTYRRVIGLGQKSATIGSGIWVTSGSNYRNVMLRKYNGTSGTTLAEGPYVYHTGILLHITLQVIDYGSTATLNVYFDEALVLTYTGDVTVSGMSAMDCVLFSGNAGYSFGSEFIVADRDPRALNLKTHSPNGAGTTNNWTGAYTDIDEGAISDADVVYVNTDAQDGQFALVDCPSGVFNVRGVKIAARASSPHGSVANALKLGLFSASTVDVDDGRPLLESWKTYERWATEINGGPMTPALLTAMELNLRSKANPVAAPLDVAAQAAVGAVAVSTV